MISAVLPDRLPWYLAGPALGLLVVGFFMFTNQPLGATGAYVETAKTVRRVPGAVSWRAFYFVGIALGGLAAVLLKEDGFVARKGYDVLLDARGIRGDLRWGHRDGLWRSNGRWLYIRPWHLRHRAALSSQLGSNDQFHVRRSRNHLLCQPILRARNHS